MCIRLFMDLVVVLVLWLLDWVCLFSIGVLLLTRWILQDCGMVWFDLNSLIVLIGWLICCICMIVMFADVFLCVWLYCVCLFVCLLTCCFVALNLYCSSVGFVIRVVFLFSWLWVLLVIYFRWYLFVIVLVLTVLGLTIWLILEWCELWCLKILSVCLFYFKLLGVFLFYVLGVLTLAVVLICIMGGLGWPGSCFVLLYLICFIVY